MRSECCEPAPQGASGDLVLDPNLRGRLPVGRLVMTGLVLTSLSLQALECVGRARGILPTATPGLTLTPTETPFVNKPIPGLDVKDVLGPPSLYTTPDGLGIAGRLVEQGTDAQGFYYGVYTDFTCKGKGCPETLIVGGPNGMPLPGSCVGGYREEEVVNPNFDSTNPSSHRTLWRYFEINDSDACSVAPNHGE